jgi:microcystin-dependent protein
MERGSSFSEGYLDIYMPGSDVPGTNVYDGSPRSVNADGIILNGWEALYFEHVVGADNSTANGIFHIVRYTNNFSAPSNWLLVAVVNEEDETVKLGTGAIVSSKSSISHGNPMPVGTILMWHGDTANVPGGWALCDGQNGTPDLRDRFIVGAGANYPVSNTGGANTIALDESQIPAHAHNGRTTADGKHRHIIPLKTNDHGTELDWCSPNNVWANVQYFDRSGDPGTWSGVDHWGWTYDRDLTQNWAANARPAPNAPTFGEGRHDHPIQTNNTGGNAAHENRPPFYALCFIMKL